MQMIMTISEEYKIPVLNILNLNFDDFALLVNYLIEKNDTAETVEEVTNDSSASKEKDHSFWAMI